MSLYLSIRMPNRDLEKSAMHRAVTQMAERVALQKRLQAAPSDRVMDVAFLMSDDRDAPPFSGMRMGGYQPKDNVLYFQAAVPQALSDSDLADDYVALVLQDVVDNAADYFSEAQLSFDAEAWRDWCAQLQTTERAQSAQRASQECLS